MSAQAIGLDIGTHAVRAVELSMGRGRPSVKRMGQVALPSGAVVGGEVMDPATVASALRRLWREVGFRDRSVVVGVANSRVVARIAEVPAVPDDEIRTSLRFQVQDLIPIPIDEAEIDFQIVDRDVTVGEELRVRMLLVAAHRDMLRNLVAALEGAGLSAARIDLIPLALIRAILRQQPAAVAGLAEPDGQDVIIDSGAGVTNIVVHDRGVPSFVRSLPTGGALVTDAIATDLDIPGTVAEALKRQVGMPSTLLVSPLVHDIASRSLVPLAAEVSSSLDFHSTQLADASLRQVVLSGGGARMLPLRALLTEQLGIPVTTPDPFVGIDTSSVRFDQDLARVGDQFLVAVGLALPADAASGQSIDLRSREADAMRVERRRTVKAGAGVGALALVLAGLTVVRTGQVSDANAEASRSEAVVSTLNTRIGSYTKVAQVEGDIQARSQVVSKALEGDIAWSPLLRDISASLPGDVWITSFQATRGVAGAAGKVQLVAMGDNQTSAARWLEQSGHLESLASPWVSSSAKAADGGPSAVVSFTATADLAPGAAVDRGAQFGVHK
jgi:type IV pilus assembly protein PilM